MGKNLFGMSSFNYHHLYFGNIVTAVNTTAQLHLTKLDLRFCVCSDPIRSVASSVNYFAKAIPPSLDHYHRGTQKNICMMMILMMNCFVVWLTDERRLALFPAGNIVRYPHNRESPTRRSQVLILHRIWVQAQLNEAVQ